MFSRNKGTIGLDIGSSAIKLAEIKETKRGWALENFGMVPLQNEAIVDGAFMNTGAVVDGIIDLISKEKIKAKDVVTSVSGHSVIVKKITLPQMTEEELEESIQWEAEQYIPFDINDVNMDVQIIGEDEADVGQMKVILVAAKKDIINDYVQAIAEAGMNPIIMDIDCFAIENMFEINYDVDPSQTIVLANLGASIININILKGGITAFTRDINMGGNQFTEEIQKQLNVSYEEAEALKLGGDMGGPSETTEAVIPQEVGGIIRSVSETLASEIQRSLDFYAATSVEEQVSKIYLSGGTSKVPGLPAIVEGKLGIPTEVVNPFQALEIDERRFDVSHLQDIAPIAAVSLGLALRRLNDR